MNSSLDQVVLNFDKGSLLLLNLCIAFIMFGVALELKLAHFRLLFRTPKPIFVGLFSQLLLLPLATFGLIHIINPIPSIALGMMLVASCPGGNVSNFYVAMSKGNVALSVSLTAFSSVMSVLFTPVSFTLWSKAYAPTADMLHSIDMDVWDMVIKIIWVLVIPLIVGMTFGEKLPELTKKISKPIKKLSILIFTSFVVLALKKNFDHFLAHISAILLLVFLHNALGLISGFGLSTLARLSSPDRRAVTIETGIQNVSVALVIIFDFFDGLGGMAFIAAWWGVWHLIAGGFLSYLWSKKTIVP
ncbi:bile acid:sodium symporter family protein [Reichenbachiella versicolor]|uniref:bile acid:sodium symporter family protein n=1 Tax=Reichenbachiella versicolor TaxID=1821036 RepID=UPI000D6E7871|nr:bile acid:sodium symporter family protein [Reichenbachiella versicolor]